MADAAQIAALAERVERLSGPDFDAERAIALTTGLFVKERRGRDRQDWFYSTTGGWRRNTSAYAGYDRLPRYTASLDAAMTLVPEGWHVGYLTECDENNAPHCCLTENAEPCRDAVGDGADMALSLAAAALRARAQSQEPSDGE